jgi:hypothetical protein
MEEKKNLRHWYPHQNGDLPAVRERIYSVIDSGRDNAQGDTYLAEDHLKYPHEIRKSDPKQQERENRGRTPIYDTQGK